LPSIPTGTLQCCKHVLLLCFKHCSRAAAVGHAPCYHNCHCRCSC
jgi:hypothetical protein